MHTKIALFVLFFNILVQNECLTLDDKLRDVKWQCETICTGSGSKAEFNAETEICKCLVGENVDGAEIELLKKSATMLGINLITDETTSKVTTELEESTTLVATTQITEMEEKAEGIVGQQAPKLPHRLVSQRRSHRNRDLRPISPEQQRQISHQVRDHLNRLNQSTDQRARQTEIDAVRALIRQLSQSIVVQDPQQRSKMSSDRLKNMVQQVKQRQNRLRVMQGPRVGTSLTNTEKETENASEENKADIPTGKKRMKMHFDIITQNPALIDE